MKKILFLLIMTFGMITKVKALNYDYNIGQEISVNTSHWDRNITIASSNSQSGLTSTDFNFNQTYQFNNSKFIRFTYTSNFVTSNNSNELINWTETCSSTQFITATGAKSYTITYADGSHATITGNITDYEGYCSQYTTTGTVSSSSLNITEFTPQIYLMTTGGGSWSQCEMDNSFILCPVTPNLNYSGLRFYFYRQTFSGANAYFSIYLRKDILTINSDAQQIINNNNTNTQQVINSQNNINNSITSNDVTGNNSNSSITSIGNTFSTQEDFLLNLLTIPYTLWTSILNVFSNTCTSLDVGTIFNYHLVFPCIELNQFLGGIYATIIDVIFTAIIYSAFIRRVMKYFRELLTLDEHALVTGGVKLW